MFVSFIIIALVFCWLGSWFYFMTCFPTDSIHYAFAYRNSLRWSRQFALRKHNMKQRLTPPQEHKFSFGCNHKLNGLKGKLLKKNHFSKKIFAEMSSIAFHHSHTWFFIFSIHLWEKPKQFWVSHETEKILSSKPKKKIS